jgi:two-component system chemotaxis response regulator CheB
LDALTSHVNAGVHKEWYDIGMRVPLDLLSRKKVVVVAASAGGIEALFEFVTALPVDFPAPVVILQHLPPAASYQSQLRELLKRRTALSVKWITDGEPLRRGTIFLSPQDMQTTISNRQRFRLSVIARSPRFRPAADPLFVSAAKHFREHSVAVVLTGRLSDGAVGARHIAAAGGRVFAQNEESSLMFDMPRAVIRQGVVDFILTPSGIAHALTALMMARGTDAWFQVKKPRPDWFCDN